MGRYQVIVVREAIGVCAVLCVALGSVAAVEPELGPVVVVAQGTKTVYQGHPTTVTTKDGRIIAVWTDGHGGRCGPAAETSDGGLTWTRIDSRFPAVYRETHMNCPELRRVEGPDGKSRLCIFSRKGVCDDKDVTKPLAVMMSEDEGRSWRETGVFPQLPSVMPPTGLMQLKDGRTAIFGQMRESAGGEQSVWMAVSPDGGFTWRDRRVVARAAGRDLCEPFVLRSPDGGELAMLMRDNRHDGRSAICFSTDEGASWSAPVDTSCELTGDRHQGLQLADGRYFIAMRDRARNSPTAGQFVGWLGTWSDIKSGMPGQMRFRIVSHYPSAEHLIADWDTGYSGVEQVSGDTVLCTTYARHENDGNRNSLVARQVKLPPPVLRPMRHVAYRSFNKEPEATARFAKMGYGTRCFFAANTYNGCCQPYCQYAPMWKGDETYDFAPFDEQVDDLLKASPDADFLCLVDLNSPAWFTRRYGIVDDSFSNMTHVLFNPLWRTLTGKWMKAFLAHAEKRLAGRIKGYVLVGGCTCEWYENDYGRSSRAKNAEWRKWCERRGVRHGDATPTETELPKASFENALYDPAIEADKIDYWRFHNSIAADAIVHFAAEARTVLPRGRELGVFFGYYNVVEGTQVSLGHLDYLRVFDSPDIDFIVAPGLYAGRGCGGGSGSLAMFADAHLRGKRLLHEIDFWPSTKPSRFGRYFKSVEDDVAGNTREAAFALVNAASWWWFDMWGGFYTTPPLLDRIAALRKVERRFHDDGPGAVADVLLVADPESVFFTNEKDEKTYGFGQRLYRAVAKSGVAFDNYSWDSLARLDLSRYKVVMLPAMLLMTPERERFLNERILKDGRTVVWVYAPGITDGRTLDKSRVEKWAGVPFGTKGISKTVRDGWTSVYAYDYALLTPDVLHGLFAAAGAHLYTAKPSVVFAGERLLAVHTKDGGEIEIRLPRRAKVVKDVFSGRTVCEGADAFRHSFAAPDTALFEIEWE